MRRHFIVLFVIIISALLSGCGKQTEPTAEPTQEIYQPTRSVATVPVPTKSAACSNVMSYLGDVNYTDGAVLAPGEKFTKEWEVINYSTCSWDDRYHLFFISGNQMGAPDFVSIPQIPVGSKGKLSVELTAPMEPGEYRSEWKLFGADNRFFGESLIADIVVSNEE